MTWRSCGVNLRAGKFGSMVHMFNGVFRGKKVLVTGSTGFKGSWLTLWLLELGAEVKGVALIPETKPNHHDLLGMEYDCEYINICDRQKVKEIIARFRPDVVFHLAAQALVRRSYRHPLETYNVNVIGTANVLDAIRSIDTCKAFINVTTDKVYDNMESKKGYTESDQLGGFDPYSTSKACSELVTRSYQRSFFNIDDFGSQHSLLIATARAGNVIGGGDWAEDRILPDIIRAIQKGGKLGIRNPSAVRPWQHVLDSLHGYLLLAERLICGNKEYSGAWNFGPSDKDFATVRLLMEKAAAVWSRIEAEFPSENVFHESHLLLLDSKKAFRKLGWSNHWDLDTTVMRTISWYQDYYEEGCIASKSQLLEFCAKLS